MVLDEKKKRGKRRGASLWKGEHGQTPGINQSTQPPLNTSRPLQKQTEIFMSKNLEQNRNTRRGTGGGTGGGAGPVFTWLGVGGVGRCGVRGGGGEITGRAERGQDRK